MDKNTKLVADAKTLAVATAAALSVVAGTASAAVDVSTVTSSITDAATAGGVLGLAILVMHFGLKLFKWIKQAG